RCTIRTGRGWSRVRGDSSIMTSVPGAQVQGACLWDGAITGRHVVCNRDRPEVFMRCIVSSLYAVAVTAGVASAATFSPIADFGANPGALKAYDYIPDGLAPNAPLVVVLHGCTQTAMAMQSAGWDKLADQYGFAVLFPEQ